ncbi:MAG TPA: hypothetical protein VM030_05660, partial [Acidimicrobiales bacterium]|nr:hypothetical protein [Acidimicrobiales bacterium]
GCTGGRIPGFTISTVTAEPMHVGTICDNGTICQAQVVDRRLGDYFTVDIDTEGKVWTVYSDTRQGGAIALASFVRQTGGPSFKAGLPPVTPPTTAAAPKPGGDLPATGQQEPGRILLVLLALSVGVSQLGRFVDRGRRLA